MGDEAELDYKGMLARTRSMLARLALAIGRAEPRRDGPVSDRE
jgi:hypothetical protein